VTRGSLLKRADEAFNWRLALVDSVAKSIDIKYFIWHGNETGDLLFIRVLEATERGVRVHMLIDDLNLAATVEELSGVAGHPNVGIRLFNPTPSRSIPGALGDYARSFSEMNRRMHNKGSGVAWPQSVVDRFRLPPPRSPQVRP
jgi:putative cardiolipin synthase